MLSNAAWLGSIFEVHGIFGHKLLTSKDPEKLLKSPGFLQAVQSMDLDDAMSVVPNEKQHGRLRQQVSYASAHCLLQTAIVSSYLSEWRTNHLDRLAASGLPLPRPDNSDRLRQAVRFSKAVAKAAVKKSNPVGGGAKRLFVTAEDTKAKDLMKL